MKLDRHFQSHTYSESSLDRSTSPGYTSSTANL